MSVVAKRHIKLCTELVTYLFVRTSVLIRDLSSPPNVRLASKSEYPDSSAALYASMSNVCTPIDGSSIFRAAVEKDLREEVLVE